MFTEEDRELSRRLKKAREEADQEPVYYCADCHSLRIVINKELANDHWDGSYCDVCNSTDIRKCNIREWLFMERMRHQNEKK